MKKCKRESKRMEGAKKTEFTLSAPQAERVCIAGDFNQWDLFSHPLKKDAKGTWKIALDLKPGQYEYRFLVDGQWQNDPNCTAWVENPFGTFNCLKTVQ
jgi:1,4-alpha-glucan branching enzyme